MTHVSTVLIEDHGPIRVITLDRPDRHNAINTALGNDLRAAIDAFEGDATARIGVLAARGSSFCAGMDLAAAQSGEADAILFGPDRIGGLASRPRTKPLIAAVQGAALAGGFELALSCDMIVASRAARFGLPESRVGLVAGAGGALRLAQRLPMAIAAEMLLTGDPISAERAAELGLVNHLTEAHPLSKAMDLAQRIAGNAPQGLAAALALLRTGAGLDDAAWAENDRQLRRVLATKDATEGIQAFLDKRPPVWRGR